jgi:hypothetical protein
LAMRCQHLEERDPLGGRGVVCPGFAKTYSH